MRAVSEEERPTLLFDRCNRPRCSPRMLSVAQFAEKAPSVRPGTAFVCATGHERCRHLKRTGATGLEPATSGVTGRYELNRPSRLATGFTG